MKTADPAGLSGSHQSVGRTTNRESETFSEWVNHESRGRNNWEGERFVVRTKQLEGRYNWEGERFVVRTKQLGGRNNWEGEPPGEPFPYVFLSGELFSYCERIL
jgi:hypothetical protein